MKPIRILPHHVISLFEAFYLEWKPAEVISWYDNEAMRNNGVSAIDKMISNPNQLVQIISSSYDEVCRMCPQNKQGANYHNNPNERTCHNYDAPNPLSSEIGFAEILGLSEIVDKEPITAKRLFELMKSTYEKLLREPKHEEGNNRKKSLRQIFRIKAERDRINEFIDE